MSEKRSKPPRRGRRNVVFASLAAVAAMLVTSVGAAPAQAEVGDGVGFVSARGTESDFFTAEFSVIVNCDENADTRPFVVRWSEAGTTYTFRRTATLHSQCFTPSNFDFSKGNGFGFVNGSIPAMVSWEFSNASFGDTVKFEVDPGGSLTTLSIDTTGEPGAIGALGGSPGGVWVFGTLPWPAA